MIKTVLAASFAMFVATTANAGVFDDFKAGLKDVVQTFPAHEENGYRDTGCDATAFIDVVNEEGVVLYRNNATCPDVGGAGFDLAALSAVAVAPPAEEEPVDEGNGCESDDKNYDKHKGKGKGKR